MLSLTAEDSTAFNSTVGLRLVMTTRNNGPGARYVPRLPESGISGQR